MVYFDIFWGYVRYICLEKKHGIFRDVGKKIVLNEPIQMDSNGMFWNMLVYTIIQPERDNYQMFWDIRRHGIFQPM